MSKIPFAKIIADKRFQADCERAAAKARRAGERTRDRLIAAEDREIERHRQKMAQLHEQQRVLPRQVYDRMYDPLEEAAFFAGRTPDRREVDEGGRS